MSAVITEQDRYRKLIETIPHGIEEIDILGNIQFASRGLYTLYDCEPGQLIGQSIFDRIPTTAEARKLEIQLPKLIVNQPTIKPYFGQKKTDTGRIIDVQVDWNYKRDDDGNVVGFISIITDITERNMAMKRLSESEELHRSIFETAWNGIAVISPDGFFLECNPAFRRITGYSKIELGCRKVRQLIHPDSIHFLDQFKKQLYLNDHVHAEFHIINRHGIKIPVEILTGTTFTYHGQPAFLTFMRDLTQNKLVARQLRQHQIELAHVARMNTLGEMTAGIAHEINQPLGAIANYSKGVIRRLSNSELKPDDALINAIGEISKQAERAAQIITRLRGFAKKGELKKIEVDVNAVVRESIEFLQPELGQNDITLKKRLAKILPRVKADKIQLEQVLVNLIKNACDAVAHCPPANRRIHVQTHISHEQSVEILIHDFGPGLSEEALAHLFEPFYTTKESGMGVGLTISQSIIEAHGGTLTALPIPREGACFRLSLPIQEQ